MLICKPPRSTEILQPFQRAQMQTVFLACGATDRGKSAFGTAQHNLPTQLPERKGALVGLFSGWKEGSEALSLTYCSNLDSHVTYASIYNRILGLSLIIMPKGQKRKLQDGQGDEKCSTGAAAKAAGKKKQKASKQTAEKRVNAAGTTVRYSKAPSQKIQERIARALPGTALPSLATALPACNT